MCWGKLVSCGMKLFLVCFAVVVIILYIEDIFLACNEQNLTLYLAKAINRKKKQLQHMQFQNDLDKSLMLLNNMNFQKKKQANIFKIWAVLTN